MMMKRNLLVAILLSSASTAAAQSRSVVVRVENKLPIARTDETVGLAWSDLMRALPGLAAGRVRVAERVSGRELTAQALDANADAQIDSLLFQVTLNGNEVREYTVEAASPASKAVARVHVKFVPEREDVAWESDRIAFRIYGKKLWELENLHTNGIDVWMKRTRNLVLDSWYAKGHDEYHIDRGEGADFFQVGTTLGAGGVGIWKDGALHRGDNFLAHRIVADGPIRAIFELDYGAIDAAGTKATEKKRISIDAGQNFFRQESTFAADEKGGLEAAVGLVKRPEMVGSTSRARGWAWLSTWAPIEPRTRGHGTLGKAVLVEKSRLVDLQETDDHYLAIARTMPGQTLVSYVGAGWTSSRDFERVEDWWQLVDTFAQRLSSPLVLSIR
jgi:pectinesterase